MQITVVRSDNLAIIDGKSQKIDFALFNLPENLHALQWNTHSQHIEYTNQPNELISELPEWVNPLIEEHRRLTEENNQESALTEKQTLYINNGQARQQRLEQALLIRQQVKQKLIDDLVLEKLQ